MDRGRGSLERNCIALRVRRSQEGALEGWRLSGSGASSSSFSIDIFGLEEDIVNRKTVRGVCIYM